MEKRVETRTVRRSLRASASRRCRLFLSFLFLTGLLGLGGQASEFNDLSPKIVPEILRTMSDGNIPSASVALIYGEKIIWTGAFGYANGWAQTPAFPETVYLIGSTFKTMSSCALLQQMELGKFKLDDPVSSYLGDLKIEGNDPFRPLTFRHLLTHTSGLPGDFGPCSVWSNSSPLPLKEYLERALKLQNPPLTKVVYSNLAFTLVAFLVEKFSGVPYKKYIQQNIFDPLEMKDTAFEPRPEMVERLAIPYFFRAQDKKYVPMGWTKANVWPAGIVYGTVVNLAHWLIANLNRGVYKGHRVIGEATFEEIMRRQFDQFSGPMLDGWLNESTGCGLAWWISERNGEKIFAHSGSVTGYTAFVAGNLDRKAGFAILTNGNRAHKHLFGLAIKALDLVASEIPASPSR
ncbi:MAG: serine hydrolase domain-containing protein [Acidobacteriota bacterium]